MKEIMKKEKLNRIKASSAQIVIGKNGLTEEILNTIKKKIKKDKIIKVKLLKTVPELEKLGRKKCAELLAKKLNVNLIEIRGYSIILQKRIN